MGSTAELRALLRCPACRQELADDAGDGGGLRCAGCGARYATTGGVPRFPAASAMRATARQFRSQWTLRSAGAFEGAGHTYAMSHEAAVAQADAALGLAELEGGWVLDAGCGTGERTWAMARAFPGLRFVGLDLSAGFDNLPAQWRDTPNLWFVEGDLKNLPLATGAVTACACLGVLHHLPDPDAAFDTLASTLAPDGRLLVMLYPAVDETGPFFARSYRFRDRYGALLRRLPPPLRLRAIDAGARRLRDAAPAAWDEQPGGRRRILRFWLHDQVMPQWQWRIDRSRAAGMFTRNGFPAPDDLGHGSYAARRTEG